jgi:diadenosine tetraphosphate (Ap4A) HIT family hydrolase
MKKSEYMTYLSEEFEFVLYEDDKFRAVLINEPWTKGHLAVIPKRIFPTLDAMHPIYRDSLLKVGKKVAEKITEKLKAKSFHYIIDEGTIADPDSLVYLQIIPRYSKREIAVEHRVHKDRLDKIFALIQY